MTNKRTARHPQSLPAPPHLLLGIEGGATRTVGILSTLDRQIVQRIDAGPGNLRLLDDRALVRLLASFANPAKTLASIAIGLAGCRTESDRDRVRRAAGVLWPNVPCLATNDLETALAAAPHADGPLPLRVLVLSGTGSCCFAKSASGHPIKAGGWGHLLGDQGSAYDIGLNAVRAVLAEFDATGQWPALGERLLRASTLNQPDDFIAWIQQAAKDEVAALAVEVFAAFRRRDRLAATIVQAAASSLATQALACAVRLGPRRATIEFVFAGGTLLHQPAYARTVAQAITRTHPNSRILHLNRTGAWGAVELASAHLGHAIRSAPASQARTQRSRPPSPPPDARVPVLDLAHSPTEQRNPASAELHRLSAARAIELFLAEDERIPTALRSERNAIRRALHLIVSSLRRRGRLFYVGAGTSGRLGVLDASECPPTFRTPPDLVQGIIAGGQRALASAVEGAEDNPDAGAQAIRFRGVGSRDVVLGIAASGRTPFVWGALAEARARGATTILLCFNPALKRLRTNRPDLIIAPNLGPELLTGSSRLKAGTATKLVLNLLTTLAMVHLGKVVSNLMVDLNPSNAKLRDRAVRIVHELTGLPPAAARSALETSNWIVRAALRRPKSPRRAAPRNFSFPPRPPAGKLPPP